MTITIEEIKRILRSGELSPSHNDVFATGNLKRPDHSEESYTAHCGWDIAKAYACDNEWGEFNIQILSHIDEKNLDDKARLEILDTISLEDSHWEWFKKAAIFNSDKYRWFFLFSEGKPQAACLVYQPKQSAFFDGNIFYVEYIAVAPWNRINPLQGRVFNGVGTCLLKHAVDHCIGTLGLRPGFSLHALPKAIPFYKKIGMIPFSEMDKDNLPYYEMPEPAFKVFAGIQ